jgi:hypothetical protein
MAHDQCANCSFLVIKNQIYSYEKVDYFFVGIVLYAILPDMADVFLDSILLLSEGGVSRQ